MSFARDRLVETFMCSVGFAFEPENRCFRKWLTKVLNLVAMIDDVYDVYGTLEELTHFTNAVTRLVLIDCNISRANINAIMHGSCSIMLTRILISTR